VLEYSKWKGWVTVVVGDRKTPSTWKADKVVFLSLDEQYNTFPAFAKAINENTYVRKMVGYLYAIKNGADFIFETDDDNIPYCNALDVIEKDVIDDKKIKCIESSNGWLNIYKEFGATDAWPRGYPIQLLHSFAETKISDSHLPWDVCQYLADEDPDVDAIFRITKGQRIFFKRDHQFGLAYNSFSPFNSQATLWKKEAFPLLFLPVGVTDRVTDILRGYISLACLKKKGSTLKVASPVVYQHRNVHNLLKDFEQEADLYLHAENWARALMHIDGNNMIELFKSALLALIDRQFLKADNLDLYNDFIREIS